MSRTRVLILGGGYVGLYAALNLQQRPPTTSTSPSLDRRAYMTYQPFLPEAAAGSIEPRHAVVPLRKELQGSRSSRPRSPAIRHADRAVDAATDFGDHAPPRLRRGGGRARFCRPHAPYSGAQGLRYRLQVRRGGHQLAQSGAWAASREQRARDDPRWRTAPADVCVRRRRLCRSRGLRRGRGHGEGRASVLPGDRSAGTALHLVEATDRILPEMGPDMGTTPPQQLRGARHGGALGDHASGVLRRGLHRVVERRLLRGRHRGVDCGR